jgi:hypothetical protein
LPNTQQIIQNRLNIKTGTNQVFGTIGEGLTPEQTAKAESVAFQPSTKPEFTLLSLVAPVTYDEMRSQLSTATSVWQKAAIVGMAGLSAIPVVPEIRGAKMLSKLTPEDISIAERFIDYARTVGKKDVQPELEIAARYLADGLGINKEVGNAKLANNLDDVLARWTKIDKGLNAVPVRKYTDTAAYKITQPLAQEAGKTEEQVVSDIFQKELASLKTEGRKNLANDIKELGGIKVSGGIKEETLGNVPLNLLNKKGLSADEMASSLNNAGYQNITDANDLLNELGDLYGGKTTRTPKSIFRKVAQETSATKTQSTKLLSPAEQEYQSRLANIEASVKDAGILPDEIDELTDRMSLPQEIAQDKNGVKLPVGRGGITPPEFDFVNWKDKGTLSLSRETLERNLDRVAGKDATLAKEFLVDASRNNETMRTKFVNNLRNDARNLVDKLKISAGSKDDALVQRFGEGTITLEELKTQTKNWENVVEASKYFRKTYDELLDLVNQTWRRLITSRYPKDKIISDTFRNLGES